VSGRPWRRVLLLALLALALAACGKKGPPVAPELRLPVPPTGLQASIDEDAILVGWTNPGSRLDGSRLKDLAEVKLYRREDSDDGPLKPAMLSRGRVVGYDQIAVIRLDAPAPATVVGTSVRWVDRQGLLPGHRYTYVLTAIDAQGRSSPPSERRPVTFLAAPMPPRDVEAAAGNREVTLSWRAPAEFTDGNPASGDLRYIVLRGVGSAGPLAVITPQPLAATSYTETGLENETEYRYAVRAVRVDSRATVTGAPSAVIAARPREIVRPIPPRNLVAVPSSGALRLAWSPNPEASVALYAIYRATGADALVRIGTTLSGNTTFIDRDVRPGTTYRYAVTAIDNARTPNESPPSNEVTVTLP
jgi:predicted small lipoprotein YifL